MALRNQYRPAAHFCALTDVPFIARLVWGHLPIREHNVVLPFGELGRGQTGASEIAAALGVVPRYVRPMSPHWPSKVEL